MNLFPLLYFPPISYFLNWKKSLNIFVESHDNYQKQSFRNRMDILFTCGRFKLSIPVVHDQTRLYRNLKISFNTPWQRVHWKTLCYAYRNSCYFEYYEDVIYKLIYQDTDYLFKFNQNILNWIIKIFNLSDYKLTTKFQHIIIGQDYRNDYSRKRFDIKKKVISYHQVFSDRYIFENNLSILDLLFNIGPKIDL